MKMRNHLFFSAMMLSLPSAVHAAEKTQALNRSNVLFIAIDDLRPSLGCYGDRLTKTPNIDRLADAGLRFNRAYCQQAVCGPSRVSLLTGLLPDRTHVWHNRHLFRDTLPNAVTLPQLFKNNGYHAQSIGKVFSGRNREAELDPPSWSVPPLLKGKGWRNYVFEANDGGKNKGTACEAADVDNEGYSDGTLASLAIATLEELKRKETPFFLAVGFFKPHLPFNAPKKYWDLYDPADKFFRNASWAQKIYLYSDSIWKKWDLLCHFGVIRYQGKLTQSGSKNYGYLGGDKSLFKISNLYEFCSPLLGFFWFVPGFVVLDRSTQNI